MRMNIVPDGGPSGKVKAPANDLGFYNPVAAGGEQGLRVALDRVTHWAGLGAKASPTVERLLDQARKAVAGGAAA